MCGLSSPLALSSEQLVFPLVLPLLLQASHSKPRTPTLPSSLPFPLHYSRMLSSGCTGMGGECDEGHERSITNNMSMTNNSLCSSMRTRRERRRVDEEDGRDEAGV